MIISIRIAHILRHPNNQSNHPIGDAFHASVSEKKKSHSFLSLNNNMGQETRRLSITQSKPKLLRPFNTAEVKILLLENVNITAIESFKKQGYQVKERKKKLTKIVYTFYFRLRRTVKLWWVMN
jgi:hypothetical protein